MNGPRRDPDLVRAYVRAGGRSRPTRELDLVTLVLAAADPPPAASVESRRVHHICRNALTVAEVAAHLDLPPSVVLIVVADLIDSGALNIPAPTHELPPISLLEEVLDGLRALAV